MDGIEIKFKVSVVKLLQAKWIVELCNYLTSEKGYDVIRKGWNLEILDPFAAIDPLEHGSTFPLIENGNLDQFDISSFVICYSNEDDYDEGDIEGNLIRNIFEIIEDVV